MKLLSLLSPYLFALILTLIIEGALCLLIKRSTDWLKFTCLVNLLTNPLINFIYSIVYYSFGNLGLIGAAPYILILLEIAVWLSESWLFYRFAFIQNNEQNKSVSSIYKVLLFSLALNAVSYGTGLLLQL